ncbi:MAG TPA: IS1380 family transposase [Ottowia sp.]|nr:IS1380 family transposase [Pseudomonadota bacterium]HNO43392.1 IS1380 family transposase [Ottowia sp.]
MPKCTEHKLDFGRLGRRVIEADFSGGDLSSEGGALLLGRMDARLGLSAAAARAVTDSRQRGKVRHDVQHMIAQRMYGLCLGWADVCDHNALRNDLVMQTAVGRDQALASAPTLSRLETAATPEHARALGGVLVDQFIASRRGPRRRAPREVVLDVDATHVPLHGAQEKSFFHGYYDNYCYLPLYVFCGQDLLACVLRPSDRDPASVVTALLKRLIDRLRQAWPNVRIVVRGDSGFCRPRVLRRLEQWGVDYVLGLQKNTRLLQRTELAEMALAERYQARGTKQRLYGEFEYAADSWNKSRRVIARLEHGPQGANPRFIVTTLRGEPKHLYDKRYCARGEAENRIKEAQLDLFGRRASCHRFWANQWRLLLAALAYTLMINLRRQALAGTALANACTATIRVQLLKIAAAIVRNTRRVRVMLTSSHPMRATFAMAAQALAP